MSCPRCEHSELFRTTPYLIHCTLPHSRQSGNLFVRKTPWVELRLASTFDLPYGTLARLYYDNILTTAVKTQSPRVLVARNLSDLARVVGLENPNGRELRRVKKQFFACLGASWTIIPSVVEEDPKSGLIDVKIENWRLHCEGAFKLDPKQPDNLELYDLEVELCPGFWESVRARAAPFDMRALLALKGSSLAMDLYLWANLKAPRLSKPEIFRYSWLMEQFGAGYDPTTKQGRKNFKKRLDPQLRKVLTVWPDLRISPVEGGIELRPSKAHVRLIQ